MLAQENPLRSHSLMAPKLTKSAHYDTRSVADIKSET
jgi:hypothetical protein